MSNKTINILPSPTFRWLQVNNAAIADIDVANSKEKEICFACPNMELVKHTYNYRENESENLKVSVNSSIEGVLIIENSSIGTGSQGELDINIELKDHAKLTLVQVISMDSRDTLISNITINHGEFSDLDIIQVYMGGKAYINVSSNLNGHKSKTDIQSAYIVKNEDVLDINYVINHFGTESECSLESKGVLYSGAKKTYRGTIDFKRGCKGALGSETEDVLLMENNIINKTVPVILCAEEDVEGNHGATIGRLSDELLFYLCSRGISEEMAYKIMSNERIKSVIKLIPEESTRDRAMELLEKDK